MSQTAEIVKKNSSHNLSLSSVDVPHLLAPLPRNAENIYHSAAMSQRWDLIARHMPGAKGEVLRNTLEGANAAEDYLAISRTIGFLYEAIGHDITDVGYLRDTLYENRSRFFPQSLQNLEHFAPEQVSKSHEGRNPLLHTCDDLAQYAVDVAQTPEKSRQSDSMIFIEVAAILLHDYGKLFDPKDPSHGSGSVRWSEKWVAGLAETFPDKTIDKDILTYQLNFLMKFHDLPGNIDLGNLDIEGAVRVMLDEGYIPSNQLLLSLERVQEADMLGTPGMPREFRQKNRQILRQLRQTIENIKIEYGVADSIVPTEQLISTDKDLVTEFFAMISRAEV